MSVTDPKQLGARGVLPPEDSGKPGGTAVWVLIPYYPGDQGQRPLPPSVPFWTSPGIHVNGSPYAGQPLDVGTPVALTVQCLNLGALTTSTLVSLWWADPTAAFTGPNLHIIGQQSLTLSTNSIKTSPPITWQPAPGIPPHVCLLAQLTSALDTSATFDPANDRHYAQQNVQVASAAPGHRAHFRFKLGNFSARRSHCRLVISEVLSSRATLYPFLGNDTVRLSPQHLEMRVHPTRGDADLKDRTLDITLDPNEQLAVELTVTVPGTAAPNSVIVMEARQYRGESNHLVGGIGFIVRVI